MKTCSHCGSLMASVSRSCLKCGSDAAGGLPRAAAGSLALDRCVECGTLVASGATLCARCQTKSSVLSRATTAPARPLPQLGTSASRSGGDGLYDVLAEPSDEEVQHWGEAVRLSAAVTSNPEYTELARRIEIGVDRDRPELNAYAVETDTDGAPRIVLYGGLVRAYTLTAVAAALARKACDGEPNQFANSFRPRFRLVADCITRHGGLLPPGIGLPSVVFGTEIFVQTLRADTHAVIQQSRTYLVGMLLAVIGHEMGHVLLRHVRSQQLPGGSPTQVSQEHQADAFARSVCESVPFQTDVTFAGFLDALLWAWVATTNDRPTTHPGARSRLHRFVDENQELLKLGITVASLSAFLPESRH